MTHARLSKGVVTKEYSIKKKKKKVNQYRSDTAVVHSSTFFTVPHRSQRISIRNNSNNKNPVSITLNICILIETELDVMIVNHLKADQQIYMLGIMHWKEQYGVNS